MTPLVKKLLREPLVHFLLIGAGLFAMAGLPGTGSLPQSGAPGQPSRKIIVTQGQIEHIAATFARTWQRAPTPQELVGLIDRHVRDEVGYREAMAMGLDRDDPVIRNRLRLKLEMMTEDLTASLSPSDVELRTFLEEHADEFRIEPRVAFEQVYFNTDRRGAKAADDARATLARLGADGSKLNSEKLGDPLVSLPRRFDLTDSTGVARLFGTAFSGEVLAMEPGRWQGPVASGYGLHLVRVTAREPGRLPALDEVSEDVEQEWLFAKRNEMKEALFDELLARYEVIIEAAADTAGSSAGAAAGRPDGGAQ
jgi:hypothetical protein